MRRMYDKEEIKEIAAESGGNKVDSLDLVVGQPTVTYDTTDGITIESTGKLNGTDDIVVSNEIPIVAGKGIVIDKLADKEQVEVKVNISAAAKSDYSGTEANNSVVIGDNQNIYDDAKNNIIAIGNNNNFKHSSSPAIFIGNNLNTQNTYHSVTIGTSITTKNANNSVTIGAGAKSTSSFTTSVGAQSKANFGYHTAIGYNTETKESASLTQTAIGALNDPMSDNDVFAIGDGKLIATHTCFKITKDSSNVYHMFLDNTEVPTQTKTLFGNQSIVGSGNIDLFCHNISFQDKVFFTAYSSNNLEVNSLTDLQTLFPADVWKSASGSSPDSTKVVCAINCSQMKVRYTDNTESSLAEYEAPVDTVNTI